MRHAGGVLSAPRAVPRSRRTRPARPAWRRRPRRAPASPSGRRARTGPGPRRTTRRTPLRSGAPSAPRSRSAAPVHSRSACRRRADVRCSGPRGADMGTTLQFTGLTKRFGATLAVDDLTAQVRPGAVTGFLGPNGAGKTTSLRMLLGLVTPTAGTATFDGQRYDELTDPARQVGTLLEATGFHPGRTARDHLRVVATA